MLIKTYTNFRYHYPMKNLYSLLPLLAILSACTTNEHLHPSQNAQVNLLADHKQAKENGFLQNNLDSWLNDEWTPNIEKNETIKSMNKNEQRNFTLQEYVDKMTVYLKEHNSSYQNSHIKKIDAMPVIGKKRK
jgi:hypothetical protein